MKFSLHVRIDVTQMLLLIAWQQAYIFKRLGKKVNFLRKNKQIFDIYNFKKALKRVRMIRKVISSCFAAYDIIFLARKSNNLIFKFRRTVMFLFAKNIEYIFRVSPMVCQRVSVWMTIKVLSC